MHGFGPAILHSIPKDRGASVEEIRGSLDKTPSRGTVQAHLSELVRLGCVERVQRGVYRRLVDSELEVPA